MWHSLYAEGEIRGKDDKSILQITRLCVYYSELEHSVQQLFAFAFFFFSREKKKKERKYHSRLQVQSETRKAIITVKDEERESESPSGILICSSSFVPQETASDSGLV